MNRRALRLEELIDRELEGALSIEDHEELEGLLLEHPELALERRLLEDFRTHDLHAGDEGAVERVLERLSRRQGAHKEPPRRRVPAVALWLAVAVVFTAGGAAGLWIAQSRTEDEPAPTRAAARRSSLGSPERTSEEDPDPEPDVDVALEPEISPAFPPESEIAVSQRPRSRRSQPAAPEPTAAELFAQANQARRERQFERAADLYMELQRAHGAAREARASRVSLGRIYLGPLQSPSRALVQFDAYLDGNPRGTLAVEARYGRAEALGRLGRAAQEADAWRILLRLHPDSPYGERARSRLSLLSP